MTAPPSKSDFVIIQVHSGPKVLKSWYGLTLDGSMTISDLYFKIKDGEIDPENPIADLAGLIQFPRCFCFREEFMGDPGRGLRQGNKDFILGKYNEPIPFFIVKKGAQDFFRGKISQKLGQGTT